MCGKFAGKVLELVLRKRAGQRNLRTSQDEGHTVNQLQVEDSFAITCDESEQDEISRAGTSRCLVIPDLQRYGVLPKIDRKSVV